MPKATKSSRLGRVARRMAAAEPLPISVGKEPSTFDEEPSTQTLSRGQRRRQAKRDQYRKREQMILSSLRLKSQEEQKGRIDGLDAIREALMNTTKHGKVEQNDPNNASSFKTNKGKKRLLVEESHHLSLVSQHPAFKADPFETIQEHLRNTLAEQREHLQLEAEKRTHEERRKQEEQKQRKKERLQGVRKKSKNKFKARGAKFK